MNKIVMSSILCLCASVGIAQAPAPHKTPITTVASTSPAPHETPVSPTVKPETKKVQTPTTVVLHPKEITQGELTVSSDEAVKTDAEHLNRLNLQLQQIIADAKTRLGWDAAINQINSDIEKTKKFNGWDNSVNFNVENNQWTKTENK